MLHPDPNFVVRPTIKSEALVSLFICFFCVFQYCGGLVLTLFFEMSSKNQSLSHFLLTKIPIYFQAVTNGMYKADFFLFFSTVEKPLLLTILVQQYNSRATQSPRIWTSYFSFIQILGFIFKNSEFIRNEIIKIKSTAVFLCKQYEHAWRYMPFYIIFHIHI